MRTILIKEVKDIIYSPQGWFFIVASMSILGLLTWILPGSFNLVDAGYATLSDVFNLLTYIFATLTPILTMRGFSDEKRLKTWELLTSRPISLWQVYIGKFCAIWLFLVGCILLTIIYLTSICLFSVNGLDWGQIVVAYWGEVMLSAVFVAVGLFASSHHRYSVVAFAEAMLLNLTILIGFNWMSELFQQGVLQTYVEELGLLRHFQEANRGMFTLKSVCVFGAYLAVFSTATLYILSSSKKIQQKWMFGVCLSLLVLLTSGWSSSFRIDCTADKRFSLSPYTLQVLEKLHVREKKITVNVYLEGELNRGFLRLREQIDYLLADAGKVSKNVFSVHYINVLSAYPSPKEAYVEMDKKGIKATVITAKDRQERVTRQLIFPYIELTDGKDSVRIKVLKSVAGNTADENLLLSAENLELQFADACRLFVPESERQIAFLEGNGELPQPYVLEAEEELSRYFSISRGQIGEDASTLLPFEVVIIAGTLKEYSDYQKFILDQYLMRGGRVLWLLDGAVFNEQVLSATGKSAIRANKTGLDDMLFNYGVRINANILQDKQSANITLKDADNQTVTIPWYFCPLLIPSPQHPVTQGIDWVRTPYPSSLDVISQPNVKTDVLLTSSSATHVSKPLEEVTFSPHIAENVPDFFNQPFCITAVAMSGRFVSAFRNRIVPDTFQNDSKSFMENSVPTKMIVVGASSVIRNELAGTGDATTVLPLGFDRTANIQYGNRDFIVNAVNWLANDDEKWMNLRLKRQILRLLDKEKIHRYGNMYLYTSALLPVLLGVMFLVVMNTIRIYRNKNR